MFFHSTSDHPAIFLQIVCPQTGKALPFDSEGEICLRSSTLMKGYLNNPEATSKVIDADGWFHTGECSVLQPGSILLLNHLLIYLFIYSQETSEYWIMLAKR